MSQPKREKKRIIKAYRKLADGLSAVLELKSTDAETYDILTAVGIDLWNDVCGKDQANGMKYQLAQVAELKARQTKGGRS